VLRRDLPQDVYLQLIGRQIEIAVSDWGVRFRFGVNSGRFTPLAQNAAVDLSITATARDFALLASGDEDADTLYFDRRVLVEGDTELVPGVRAHSTYSHTPGHTIYVVESKGEKLVLIGDLMHVAAVQFDNPAVIIQFDSDQKAAARQRMPAFADAAKNGYMIGASHLSFPGIGRLRAAGKGYTFVPVSYAGLK